MPHLTLISSQCRLGLGCRQVGNLNAKTVRRWLMATGSKPVTDAFRHYHQKRYLEEKCTVRREIVNIAKTLELITFEILAAERLRLMGFDNRLIIDCFANVVNILIWLFSTNDRLRSAKYESNYLENPFPEIKGVNLLSKTHRNDKSNLRPMTVLQE